MGLVWRALLLWVGLAGAAAQAFAAEATLVADAHVNSALPGVNSGAISNLNVGGGYTALLQFDLSTLPAGTTAAQVTRATLKLYCNRMNTSGLVSVQPVGGAWGEYSVTYATLPVLRAAVQTMAVSQAGVYVAVDVTGLVQGWVGAPGTNNGVALTAATAAVQFDSKENDLTGHAAVLDVTLSSAGSQGSPGSQGSQGPQGVQGPMGPAGTPGFPGLQGLQGVAGPQGVPGPAGAVGATGPPGPVGAAGPAGGAGAMGPQGSPGMVYRGAYASTTNYGLGDVVLWQGTSYTSLLAGNHGSTPSTSPGQWGVLSPQGNAGPAGPQGGQGVAGVQGLPGSVGPNGPVGAQGPQGIPGQAGAQGLTGPAGAQGASGPIGPQGVAGPVGMTFQGAYSSTMNYALGAGVTYGGAGYVSLAAGNRGNTPGVSPGQWGLFATGTAGAQGAAGPAGPQGLPGSMGPQGVAGAAGPTGAAGPQGPAVANYTGNYASATNYGLHDAVSFGGSTYISLVSGNVGNTPLSSPAQWALLAAQGPAGAAGGAGPQGLQGVAGAQGAAGAMGPQGPPVSFVGGWLVGSSYSVGSAVSYAGSSFIALAANTGREPDVSPSYWGLLAQAGPQGPAGMTGVAGPAGAAGAVGVTYRGAWTSGAAYQANNVVGFAGGTYLATAASTGAEPDVSPTAWAALAVNGSAGATGPAGAPATVSVGSVTTGAAGTQAAVTNSGTGGAAVLNFTIPQGAAGTNGSGGGSGGGGTSGIPFASMYHAVSFNASYYSVTSSNSAATEGDPVLTWVPASCTATQLRVFSRQANAITVTLRQGSPTAMVDTGLVCSVASGSACTASGSVAVAAGNFVDLHVSGANGTASGVWMALACD